MTKEEEQLHKNVWSVFLQLRCKDVIGWHTPNGGKRGIREAVSLKAMGVVAGIPDLIFLCPMDTGGIRVVAVELKRPKKGRMSPEQIEMRQMMLKLGVLWLTSSNWNEIVNFMHIHGVIKKWH